MGERVEQGFLLTSWPGVYEVPELTTDYTPLFRAVKAVEDSALSHRTAGLIWDAPLPGMAWDLPVHITAPKFGPRTELPGVVVHRTRRSFGDDVRFPIAGLPVVSPLRTLLDLAGDKTISTARLRRIMQKLLVERTVAPEELTLLLDAPGQRGVRGARRLRELVERSLDGDPVADSMLETRFERLLQENGITGFRRQFKPPWYDGRRGVVDFANVAARLIVEVDGRRWHSTSQAITDDHRRDRLAAANGWLVVRLRWGDIVGDGASIAEQLVATVAARTQVAQGA